MKNLLLLPTLCILAFSCKEPQSQSVETTSQEQSLYILGSKWKNQKNQSVTLDELKGKNVVLTMVFTSCQTACPVLLADMKNIHSRLGAKAKENTQMVLVSIDPENDTPEVLSAYAQTNGLNEDFTLLVSDKESIRELANVLAVKYKKISPIVFSHSNIITVLDKEGSMVTQSEGKVDHAALASAVNAL